MTHPEDVIAARQALMLEIENLMRPIDAYAAGEPVDADQLQAAARTIAAMLRATPHLFPPTTDRYDSAADTPATLALPAIWQDFAAFNRLAASASTAATAMAGTTDATELRVAAGRLRASCDGCHAPYLRPYQGAEVSSGDLEFDFESVLPKE